MLTAYTDGAVLQDGAGWGVLMPGLPERHFAGMLDSRDTVIAELWAVKMAVQQAPRGSALTVYTDSQSLPTLFARHAQPGAQWPRRDLKDLTAKILARTERCGISFSCAWASRDEPGQRAAHQLAAVGRVRGVAATRWSAQLLGQQLELWHDTRRAKRGWVVRLDGSPEVDAALLATLDEMPSEPVPLAVTGASDALVEAIRCMASGRGRTLVI